MGSGFHIFPLHEESEGLTECAKYKLWLAFFRTNQMDFSRQEFQLSQGQLREYPQESDLALLFFLCSFEPL